MYRLCDCRLESGGGVLAAFLAERVERKDMEIWDQIADMRARNGV